MIRFNSLENFRIRKVHFSLRRAWFLRHWACFLLSSARSLRRQVRLSLSGQTSRTQAILFQIIGTLSQTPSAFSSPGHASPAWRRVPTILGKLSHTPEAFLLIPGMFLQTLPFFSASLPHFRRRQVALGMLLETLGIPFHFHRILLETAGRYGLPYPKHASLDSGNILMFLAPFRKNTRYTFLAPGMLPQTLGILCHIFGTLSQTWYALLTPGMLPDAGTLFLVPQACFFKP